MCVCCLVVTFTVLYWFRLENFYFKAPKPEHRKCHFSNRAWFCLTFTIVNIEVPKPEVEISTFFGVVGNILLFFTHFEMFQAEMGTEC